MKKAPSVVIVDYGLGNLFSIRRACENVSLATAVTSQKGLIEDADALILPGVGAFGDAMRNLERLDLIDTLKVFAQSGRPLLGICLGMQLLMEESFEFGRHAGLGLIPGKVVRFESPADNGAVLKVPHVGWNRMAAAAPWAGTLLEGLDDGFFMYFVHSYYVAPEEGGAWLATTRYGDVSFCSALKYGNIYAFQGHPERSGGHGLAVYRNFERLVSGRL